MIRKYLIVFLLFFAFLKASPIIKNGDFEQGKDGNISGWSGGPAWFDNKYGGYHGTRYAFMDSNNSTSPLTQTINIAPNNEYEVKFLAACYFTGFTAITGCMQQTISIYDDTGNKQSININNLVTSTGLMEYSLKLRTGSNASKLTIKVEVGSPMPFSTLQIYFDYFRITPDPSYCQAKNLPEGFNIVDPDGGDNKNSFEIFCYKDASSKMHDLIALPIKNNSNNFVFDKNKTSINYYDLVKNPRDDFHAIEVAVNHIKYQGTLENGTPKPYIPVITTNQRKPQQIITDGKKYNVMRSTFSNINLIATPFSIDWNQTQLDECNPQKLRKALNQAVKYNTIIQDGHSICHIKKMTISLQNKYRYLTYVGKEVLKKSCKDMAEFVPNNVGVLDDKSIAGYFNIDPFAKGRGGKDIGEKGRPITAWCKYQQDLGWVWTFLTALDGKVTNSKNDLVAKQDTCSELGLYFFVPNSKQTFDRARKYLKNHKSGAEGWENYTGTIREKYKAFKNNPQKEYYIPKLGYELIWPYGPLGIYYPCQGHHDATNGCANHKWMRNEHKKGWMSGAPMHNISTMSNYADSMGAKGWVSILGEQDLNKTNDWWVSDIGAGYEFGENVKYTYNPHGTHIRTNGSKYKWPYYEPNGNYVKYAWLNFVQDSDGWIYHNDDNKDFYAYYDYLCMSETNYDTTTRYALVPGFFNAIERATTKGNTPPRFDDYQIRTKIVRKNILLDVILYKYNPKTGKINKSLLEKNAKKSVGIFLSTFNDKGELKLLQLLDEAENFDSFKGRIELVPFKLPSAIKEAYIHFFYCNPAGMNWKECWNYNGSVNYPIVTKKNNLAGESDSYDKFAIRPQNFLIEPNLNKNSKKEYYTTAGKDFNITFKAKDYTNKNTSNYNELALETNSSFVVSYQELKAGCIDGNFTPVVDNNWSFKDGFAKFTTNYSEVGKINLTIQENVGKEFAIVDKDDTDIKDRLIKESNITIYFSPSHFKIDSLLENNNKHNFTYISNKLDMSALLDLNITAQNDKNNTLVNYNTKCYAQDTNISATIIYDPTDINNSFSNLIYDLYYDKNNKEINKTNSSISILNIKNISKDIFSTKKKGEASLTIHINYPRAYNKPINPFDINMTKLEVVDKNRVKGSQKNIGTARFYYAKVKSKSDFYDDIVDTHVDTPILVSIFCNKSTNECKKFGIDINKATTNEYDWWLSLKHNAKDKDGLVELETNSSDSNIIPAKIDNFIQGIDNNVTVNDNGLNRPKIIKIAPKENMINLYPWLLYNSSSNQPPKFLYRVRFVDTPSAWSGEGKTGHTINVNSNGRKSQKVEW